MSENTVAATTDDVEPATPTVTAAGATVEATPAAVPANAPTNPVPTGSNRDDDELQPLLVGWLKDRHAFLDTVGRALHRNAHRASWHGLRLPLYALRLVVLAPRGAGRVLRALFLFLSDAEGRPLRVDAVTESDAATWLRLRKERNERVRRRLIVAGTLTAPVALLVLATLWPAVAAGAAGVLVLALTVVTVKDTLVGILVGVVAGGVTVWLLPRVIAPLHLSPPPWWVLVVAGFVGVLVLGYVGRPIGKPLVQPAVLLAGVHEPLRAPHVMKALCSLGISGMRDPEQIGLLFDVAREGPGYRVDLELPAGVPASAVLARRSQLSAALRREVGTVWPAVGKRHEGHLVLYAADEPMTGAKQPRWPLLKTGEVDLFNPVPMFTDQQGRWVNVTLAYANFVIGALPRMGKTFLLREALLIAGLDPRARGYAIDGKGTGDLSPCELYAHFNARGDRPEQVERVLHAFRGLREEMRRRADVIDGLPREEAPESKVGSRLASRRELGLEPIVVGIDETQAYFEYGDDGDKDAKAIRDELVAIATDLVKRGPAVGIIVLLATQNVNRSTIPTSISNNAVLRFCLKVFNQPANDQILGTGAYKAGVDAATFATEDKGIGYLRGEDVEPKIVRSVHGLDAVAQRRWRCGPGRCGCRRDG